MSDDLYRRLYGSIEAPEDINELMLPRGAREVEHRPKGERISDAIRRTKRAARRTRILDWILKRGSFQEERR